MAEGSGRLIARKVNGRVYNGPPARHAQDGPTPTGGAAARCACQNGRMGQPDHNEALMARLLIRMAALQQTVSAMSVTVGSLRHRADHPLPCGLFASVEPLPDPLDG